MTVGSASASIAIDVTSSPASLAGTYTIITAGSGLGNNFKLVTPTITANGATYQLRLSGNATSETVNVVSTGTLYYNAAGGQSALNAANGSNTNFSTDSAGLNNAQLQPTSLTNVYFTAGNVVTPQTIGSLGQSYTFSSLNFTGNSPSVTLSDSSGNTLTVIGAITNSGTSNQTLNVPIILGGALTVANSGSGLLTLEGGITAGLNSLTFAGSGATTVSGTSRPGGRRQCDDRRRRGRDDLGPRLPQRGIDFDQ